MKDRSFPDAVTCTQFFPSRAETSLLISCFVCRDVYHAGMKVVFDSSHLERAASLIEVCKVRGIFKRACNGAFVRKCGK
jgi:hypothetical protein